MAPNVKSSDQGSNNQPEPKIRALWLVLALAWSCLALIGYYYVHKPVSAPQVLVLVQALLDLTAAAGLTVLAGGIGRRFLLAQKLAPLERFALQAALGWGGLGCLWLAVGVMGLYRPWVAWLALLLGLFLLRKQSLAWLKELHALEMIWTGSGRLGKTLALVSVALAGSQLLFALAPPTKWDALTYHLELPKLHLQAGGFVFVEHNPFWGHPQLGENLYTWAITLRGWETAAVLGWCFMLVLLLGLIGLTARRTSVTGAMVAVVALLAGLTFRKMFSWAYVDGLTALFGLATLISLFEWSKGDQKPWYRWAGVMAGLAIGTKLTAAVLLPVFLLPVLLNRGSSNKQKWGTVVQAGLAALVVFSPWLLKNALITGNPLYPHLWPTQYTSASRLAYYSGTGMPWNWQKAWLPLAVTWLGVEGAPGYAADIGPLLMLFAVPGLLSRWRKREGWIVLGLLATGWASIALGELAAEYLKQTRLYFALLPAAGLAAAWGWEILSNITVAQIRLQRILAISTLLVLGLSAWDEASTAARLNPAGVLLGTRSREQYLDDSLGWYAVAMRELPAESQVLVLWEPRGLYAPPHAQPDSWLDRWFLARDTIGNPQTILDTWRQQGYTHLLIYAVGADFERGNQTKLDPSDWQALDDLLAPLRLQADYNGVYQLYVLTGESS